MKPVHRGAVALGALLTLALPAPARAQDVVVRSFDGTPIVAHWFPAPFAGSHHQAPTVLIGPGFGSSGETNPASGTIGRVRGHGYNVLTWDPRGFGGSGGMAEMDSPDFEARDVHALVDWVAAQRESRMDGPGDPRVGMYGASYGGGIQWVAAATDRRIDVIVPVSSWHSWLSGLDPAGTFRAGWGNVVCGEGDGRGIPDGLMSPAGAQTGSTDPRLRAACTSGNASGTFTADDERWFAARDPGRLLRRIRIPVLIEQGTVDTLFGPAEAIANHAALRHSHAPLKMIWFCGGHGACLTDGPTGLNDNQRYDRDLEWLDRWLAGNPLVDTGPAFEWQADDSVWRSGPGYPLAGAGEIAAHGSGSLVISPSGATGGGIAATPAADGLDVGLPAPGRRSDVVGAPRLELEYRGSANPQRVTVFAQVVDLQRRLVIGNQATPVPVLLDGSAHRVAVDLQAIAAHVLPSSRLELQLVAQSSLFGAQRATGRLDVASLRISLPVVDPARAARR